MMLTQTQLNRVAEIAGERARLLSAIKALEHAPDKPVMLSWVDGDHVAYPLKSSQAMPALVALRDELKAELALLGIETNGI